MFLLLLEWLFYNINNSNRLLIVFLKKEKKQRCILFEDIFFQVTDVFAKFLFCDWKKGGKLIQDKRYIAVCITFMSTHCNKYCED